MDGGKEGGCEGYECMNAGELDLSDILMLENVNQLLYFEVCLHF